LDEAVATESHQPLGQILVRRGIISEAQLDQALRNQVVYLGRLGTNLVELECVRLDYVGRALSVQLGVPHADSVLLSEVPDSLLAELEAAVCAEQQVFPLKIEGGQLHLAMIDPGREHVAEVGRLLRRPIRPYICPELRLLYTLEARYGIPRPARFLRQGTPAARPDERRTYVQTTVSVGDASFPSAPARHDDATTSEPGGDDSEFEVIVGPPVGQRLPPPPSDELILLDQRTGAPAADEELELDVSVAERPELEAIGATLAALERAGAAGEIPARLVQPIFPGTSLSVLFWIRGDSAIGCCAHPTHRQLNELQRMVVSLSEPSLMQWAWRLESPVRAASDELHSQIASFCGAPPAKEICVVPVVFHHKVVNLLCMFAAAGRFPADAFELLRPVVEAAGAAYLRISRSSAPR
jgi:hypothetical protein